MELAKQQFGGSAAGGNVSVADEVFGADYNGALIHQVVTAYMAGARAGTKAQKTRSQVRGGGAKPWRQKGTGRARAGTIRSPIWRGGGKSFAAAPRNYEQKVNRKMYRGAMRSILSELARQERLVVVTEFGITEPKTKALVAAMGGDGSKTATAIVDMNPSVELYLSARNLHYVEVVDANEIDPYVLVRAERVLISEAALLHLNERFQS